MSGSLGGIALTKARAQIPAWGRPWFDVEAATSEAFDVGASPALVIADQTIKAVIVSGGVHEGRAAYRLVGGTGEWSREIPAKGYANSEGVKLANVLADAARECGEAIDVSGVTVRLGEGYTRIAGPAIDVLNQLTPRGWYVDFAGVTRIGRRVASTYAPASPRVRVDPSAQIVELAVESLAGLVPGVVVDGFAPATDVEYVLDAGRLVARVWGGPSMTSRLASALLQIVRTETQRYRYAGSYDFRVVTQSGERLNLQPVRVATGLPDLANVPVRPGVAGCKATVTLGEIVVVTFADLDPSRPQVVAHEAADSPGWMPLTLTLGGPGALGVARKTDAVQAGPFAGAIVGGSVRIKVAL